MLCSKFKIIKGYNFKNLKLEALHDSIKEDSLKQNIKNLSEKLEKSKKISKINLYDYLINAKVSTSEDTMASKNEFNLVKAAENIPLTKIEKPVQSKQIQDVSKSVKQQSKGAKKEDTNNETTKSVKAKTKNASDETLNKNG